MYPCMFGFCISSPLAISRNYQSQLNNGPIFVSAQSVYNLLQGLFISRQGIYITDSAFAATTQPLQDFIFSSISMSIFDKRT